MPNKKIVVTGGTGAVGSAICRALVPAGYELLTISTQSSPIRVFSKLDPPNSSEPKNIINFLDSTEVINPLNNLSKHIIEVPHLNCDLSIPNSLKPNPFFGAKVAILCAANPLPNIDKNEAKKNALIDSNSLQAAVNANVGTIIFISSNHRTINHISALTNGELICPEAVAGPTNEWGYAGAKARSVALLKTLAKKHQQTMFIYNDLGWYPRKTNGYPITNINPESLLFWIAEKDLQLHILRQLELSLNKSFNHTNIHGFNVVSNNQPPPEIGNQMYFPYNISKSKKLGISHLNVFDVIQSPSPASWRKIPIYDH